MGADALDLNDIRAGLARALDAAPDAPASLSDLRCAVAVSGGADSMALVLLMAEIIGPQNITALSVDHGLRPAAAEEVRQVKTWMEKRHIPHVALKWQGEKPVSGVQEAARLARYALMEDWCVENGVPFLLLGHHRGDQAETLLLRLARGSGLRGLAGMRPARPPLTRSDGPWALRPMLETPPAFLRAYLHGMSQDWIEDPSNENERYDRVRARKLLAHPPLAGLNEERLAKTARLLSRARDALEHYITKAMECAVQLDATGTAFIAVNTLLSEHEEIALNILSRLCQSIAGRPHPPRLEQIEALYNALISGQGVERTLAGCQIAKAAGGKVLICRESANISERIDLAPGTHGLFWDGRFTINVSVRGAGYSIGQVGDTGWLALRHAGYAPNVKQIVGKSQPALWRGDKLILAPTLDVDMAGGEVKMTAQFVMATMGLDALCLDLAESP